MMPQEKWNIEQNWKGITIEYCFQLPFDGWQIKHRSSHLIKMIA